MIVPSLSKTARAHPRSRGADRCSHAARLERLGSSPLARGGPVAVGSCHGDAGLIPARAGRTPSFGAATSATRAHPRSRGADAPAPGNYDEPPGSSPLARGGQAGVSGSGPRAGLIPARAGRTCIERPVREPGRGSSPLARGGPGLRAPWPTRAGLIPARAGRTTLNPVLDLESGAHPRSRGADMMSAIVFVTAPGSSPLARGGLSDSPPVLWAPGLIPARAGRTRP